MDTRWSVDYLEDSNCGFEWELWIYTEPDCSTLVRTFPTYPSLEEVQAALATWRRDHG